MKGEKLENESDGNSYLLQRACTDLKSNAPKRPNLLSIYCVELTKVLTLPPRLTISESVRLKLKINVKLM